jgi:tRNA-intron endonuclease
MQKKDTAKETGKAAIKVLFSDERIVTENSDAARELNSQGGYGKLLEDGRLQLSLLETAYLAEKKKLVLMTAANREIPFEKLVRKAKKFEANFWTRYAVFKDIRNRGYIIKTALKFGADFRIYDRGVKPGEDHAKWILFPIHENSSLTWHDFTSKNRVAHSTKKRLLIGIVDDEGDVTYYEIRWVRP